MPTQITMPQLSDTMTEGTLVKWLKKEGDQVKANEVIAEVETDKATMEMESFDSGTLAHIVVKEGQKVAIGAAVAVLATSKESVADVKKQFAGVGKALAAAATAPAAAAPAVVGASAPAAAQKSAAANTPMPSAKGSVATLVVASSGEIHEPDEVGHGATREAAVPVPPLRGNGHVNRVFASPLARRVAADKGISLDQVHGSGPSGRVVRADVLAWQPAPAKGETADGKSTKPEAAPLAPPITTGEKQVITMTKMRVAIANQLLKSKQSIPHFYETIDIDVEEVGKLRERMNQKLEKEKVRLSIADFITRAVAYTLSRHPVLNARFDPVKNEITRYGDVNLGVAVSVPDGLIVPVLRGVNRMGLKEIRQRSSDLIDRARQQKLRREEQTEGTFTISSLGTMGIREFSAIINPPEVGILAIGSAEKRAVVRGDQIAVRSMMTVTLSADHRVVDGAEAAMFLSTLKAALEDPGMMLL